MWIKSKRNIKETKMRTLFRMVWNLLAVSSQAGCGKRMSSQNWGQGLGLRAERWEHPLPRGRWAWHEPQEGNRTLAEGPWEQPVQCHQQEALPFASLAFWTLLKWLLVYPLMWHCGSSEKHICEGLLIMSEKTLNIMLSKTIILCLLCARYCSKSFQSYSSNLPYEAGSIIISH